MWGFEGQATQRMGEDELRHGKKAVLHGVAHCPQWFSNRPE
jgi:hypothetical protein